MDGPASWDNDSKANMDSARSTTIPIPRCLRYWECVFKRCAKGMEQVLRDWRLLWTGVPGADLSMLRLEVCLTCRRQVRFTTNGGRLWLKFTAHWNRNSWDELINSATKCLFWEWECLVEKSNHKQNWYSGTGQNILVCDMLDNAEK